MRRRRGSCEYPRGSPGPHPTRSQHAHTHDTHAHAHAHAFLARFDLFEMRLFLSLELIQVFACCCGPHCRIHHSLILLGQPQERSVVAGH